MLCTIINSQLYKAVDCHKPGIKCVSCENSFNYFIFLFFLVNSLKSVSVTEQPSKDLHPEAAVANIMDKVGKEGNKLV